jgi:hypothetical protein
MGDEFGRELVTAGLISEEQLKSALDYQADIGGSLPRILVKLGFAKEEDVLEQVAKREGLALFRPDPDAGGVMVDDEIMAKLPRELVEKNDIVPLGHEAETLRLALPDPCDLAVIEQIRFLTGLEVQAELIASRHAREAISRFYARREAEGGEAGEARHRGRQDLKEVAREVAGFPGRAEATRAVAEIDASPAKLVRALAALLVSKRVLTAAELKDWVHRLE